MLIAVRSFEMAFLIHMVTNDATSLILHLGVIVLSGVIIGATMATIVGRAPMLAVVTTVTFLLAFILLYSIALPHYFGFSEAYLPLRYLGLAVPAATAIGAGGLRAVARQGSRAPTTAA
jgi:hypothetical protein